MNSVRNSFLFYLYHCCFCLYYIISSLYLDKNSSQVTDSYYEVVILFFFFFMFFLYTISLFLYPADKYLYLARDTIKKSSVSPQVCHKHNIDIVRTIIKKTAIAAMHGPHSVFDICNCTVIHCDAAGLQFISIPLKKYLTSSSNNQYLPIAKYKYLLQLLW